MLKSKRLVSILLITSMLCLMLLTGCQKNGGSSESVDNEVELQEKYTIGVVVKTMGNPFFREIAYGAVEAGKEFGVEVIPLACQKDGDIDEQIKICEDLLQRDVDALIVTPQHSEGIIPAVEAAQAEGVPFIAVDTAAKGVDIDCYIGMDNVDAGEVLADFVAQKIGGKGNVIILEGVAGASTSIDRTQGYVNALSKYPEITILASQNADFRQDKAQQVMADLLQAHKEVDAVITCNDLMALGAMVSLEEAGYKCGEDGVIIGTYDISTPVLNEVKEGKIYVTGYHWGKLYGYWGVEVALRKIKGEPIPETITTPHSEITAENVDLFLQFAEIQENYEFE